jgi:hypothetical protein
VLKKISAENQSKKITLFFDVAKRPPFPQPPGKRLIDLAGAF